MKRRNRTRARPGCPICHRFADRERDIKGRFYVACYVCGYDSRYGSAPMNRPSITRPKEDKP